MKIDLHCHTLKCKNGDSSKRAVDYDKFLSKVNQANVGIVAITNHNKFDMKQFFEFQNEDFLVWPGIELDINGIYSKGHCILIVNPNQVNDFDNKIESEVTVSPDDFSMDIDAFAKLANTFDSIVICHYQKNPSLSDLDIKKLKELLSDVPLFLEPSNLMSAGVFLAHNIESILGSDVKDWDSYEKLSFPELKMDIDSYEHFKLLIKKDPEVIKTFIDKKIKREFDIFPFEDKKEKIHITLYNDTNIIIGGKGTGKTQILKGIQQYFESMQNDSVSAYYASDTKNKFNSIIKASLCDKDFDLFECSDCSKEFEYIKAWKIPTLTKTSDYYQWLKHRKGNKNFGFTNASFKVTFTLEQYNNEYDLFKENKESINTILKNDINKYLDEEEALQMKTLLLKLLDKHKEKVIHEFSKAYAIYLENLTINKIKELYQIKKGKNSKPNCTGLMLLYESCYKLNKSVEIIINHILDNKKVIYETIGRLPNKGFVYVEKSFVLNPDLSNFKPNTNYKKDDLKNLKKQLNLIKNNIYNVELTKYISDFNNKLNEANVKSLKAFMQMKSTIVLSGNDPQNDKSIEYTPSNGEQSMLILNHSLYKNKDIYILDEPEMSVGHDYINNIIVPRIIELSKLGKTVVVSTHDANIAVRTLPFIMIYRMDAGIKKKTYFGNPFNDKMVNIDDNQDKISWAKTCIDTLEGGAIAFRERGNSYGKENL